MLERAARKIGAPWLIGERRLENGMNTCLVQLTLVYLPKCYHILERSSII